MYAFLSTFVIPWKSFKGTLIEKNKVLYILSFPVCFSVFNDMRTEQSYTNAGTLNNILFLHQNICCARKAVLINIEANGDLVTTSEQV